MSPAIGPIAVLPSEAQRAAAARASPRPPSGPSRSSTRRCGASSTRRLRRARRAAVARARERLDDARDALLEAETLDEAERLCRRPWHRGAEAESPQTTGSGRLEVPGDKGRDMTELWRGFANMAATAGREVVIAQGPGLDRLGRRRQASTSTAPPRSGTERRLRARRDRRRGRRAAAASCAAFHTFGPFANPPALTLADQRRRAVGRWTTPPSSSPRAAARTPSTPPPSSPAATGTRSASPRSRSSSRASTRYHGMNAFGTSLAGHPGQPRGLRRPDPATSRTSRGTTPTRSSACSTTTPTASPRSSASP